MITHCTCISVCSWCSLICFVAAGGVGAARDLHRLKVLGVTHVVNASPIVPCFHKKALHYCFVGVYDDPEEDIAQFFPSVCHYISKVRAQRHAAHQLHVISRMYAGRGPTATFGVMLLSQRCYVPVAPQGIRKGGILVHCYAGQSRSSALVMAFLIRGPSSICSFLAHPLLHKSPDHYLRCGRTLWVSLKWRG